MFCDHETDKNWPNSKPDSSLFRCSNHVTSRSSSFTKFQQPIGQLQKIYECPERSTGPSNYHFLSDLYTLDVSLKDKLLCGDGGEGGLGSGSCGWSIYIYIFWKNLEKKAYSNCPSFFFTLEDLQTERNRMLLAKHDKTILYFATNQTSTKAYVDKKYLPNGTFEHRWLNFAHVQVWISNNHKSLQKPKIPWKTYQRVKNIWLKKLKLPSTLGANWKPKLKPNQLPPNVDLFQLLQMFFIRGAWEGQLRQAFHLRNCMAFKSHPFFNDPNPEPSLMSQKLFPKKNNHNALGSTKTLGNQGIFRIDEREPPTKIVMIICLLLQQGLGIPQILPFMVLKKGILVP